MVKNFLGIRAIEVQRKWYLDKYVSIEMVKMINQAYIPLQNFNVAKSFRILISLVWRIVQCFKSVRKRILKKKMKNDHWSKD